MAIVSRARICAAAAAAAVVALALLLAAAAPIWASDDSAAAGVVEESAVLTLDASNFSETVEKHPFIVVEFYAPWCGHCVKLAPEYEKAATILSKHDPPIVLAKVNADDETNKELASKHEVQGFPTLKIFRNEGKSIQEYNGPHEADGIVEYLKKQVGPASAEIKSSDNAGSLIGEENIITVGIFPQYSGEEYEIFMMAADKLRSNYDFGHTLDAKLLPRGDSTVTKPTIRLFKPFDELSVDSQDFSVDAIEKFIESASVPLITTFNEEPKNHPFLAKFFNSPNTKAMLFLNFSNEYVDSFKSKYREAAEINRENLVFLIGDVDTSKAVFQYFGLKEDEAPLILIQEENAKKYLKSKVEPDQIATWIQEYKEGSLTPFKKSEPIPEVNDEPVKVVVADSLHDLVINSKKNVLIEFYAPWCGHCKKLAPILDEVATKFKDDADVLIGKMDATVNDVPSEFEVRGYPTLYYASASGKLVVYEGGRTAEDIINFIQKSKDVITQTDSVKDEDVITQTDSVKDEL